MKGTKCPKNADLDIAKKKINEKICKTEQSLKWFRIPWEDNSSWLCKSPICVPSNEIVKF